ncbi:acyl-CoA dehydrogenase [Roseomonas stagni]|uniref:Acyl-CoA dehydrogenase n=1 Tax=Falsiroseomonas algicola TaxID=2716930 RepID=A0A6M1LK25_9PROT|nr:acyl-CoA dehydrogenase family protein [Falsiroseomonas algicola]NGM20319.1 acyl-CoA dehydrogenase [Falsiroseomonas algicola]
MSDSYAERQESIRLVRDSAAAVVPGDFRRIRDLRFTEAGFDAATFAEMAAMGWLALRVPEDAGGAGLGMAEYVALTEALGRGLVPEPLIPGALSATLLAAAGETPPEEYVVTAWQEAADRLVAPGTPAAARVFVPMARGAARVLLPVREASGLALYEASALPLDVQMMQDGGHVATLRPALTGARRIADDVAAAMDQALDEAALATAGYLLGVMEQSFAMTLDYLRTRRQFGKAIGSFQALQHRAVDLQLQITLTRASVEDAAAVLDAGATVPQRRAVVSRAKARAAEASMLVTRSAVQLHGAIGYTDEYDVGLFVRKAMVLANAFGSAQLHRRRFVAEMAEED